LYLTPSPFPWRPQTRRRLTGISPRQVDVRVAVGHHKGVCCPGVFGRRQLGNLDLDAEKLKSVLNGVTVVEYGGSGVLDDELHKKYNMGTKGVIGLQIHANDEIKLRFKDIRIKEL
jgi:hypothetical protein